jgi:hypothetical protein
MGALIRSFAAHPLPCHAVRSCHASPSGSGSRSACCSLCLCVLPCVSRSALGPVLGSLLDPDDQSCTVAGD